MNVEPLGELTTDPTIKDWLVSSKIIVNYFPGTPLRFVLENIANDPRPVEFSYAVRNFLNLTVEHRAEATTCVFKNYSDFVEDVGEDEVGLYINIPSDVWRHVQPSEIHVGRRAYGDMKIYVSIGANCDWEQEHGLQIVYREGHDLSRVSAQDGHLTHSDAYALPESEDRIC